MLNSGLINVLKPPGPTSSDIVTRIKRILNVKKVGHMGTLDPLAAGVLVIAVGKGTRLFDFLTYKRKKYRAIFTFGLETDTADSAGKATGKSDILPDADGINDALAHFRGRISQLPPKYSALKIGGKKAYELARAGEDFTIKTREVDIFRFEMVTEPVADSTVCGVPCKSFVFDIECSGGTYIRSLCTHLAERLGTKAYMSMLIRTGSGNFDIGAAYTLDEIEENPHEVLLPLEQVLKDLERIDVDDSQYQALSNGVKVSFNTKDTGCAAIYCREQLFGIGSVSENIVRINTYLKE